MIEQFGFKSDYAEKCINNNKHNQVTTIYYLIHKRYEKQKMLPSHFNISKQEQKTLEAKEKV
jgi:hypothetical protein